MWLLISCAAVFWCFKTDDRHVVEFLEWYTVHATRAKGSRRALSALWVPPSYYNLSSTNLNPKFRRE
jgi:hypothetical protein